MTNDDVSHGIGEKIETAPILLADEAAALLRISRRSLTNLRKRGLVRAVKLGKSLRFRRVDLEAALRKLAE